MTAPSYTTREAVKSALDFQATAYADTRVDAAVASGSRTVEGLLHRILYPHYATKDRRWPSEGGGSTYRLWLDQNELISASMIKAAGVDITAFCFLEPQEYGPPYDRIEVDLSSAAAFSSGNTPQRSILVTGLWGDQDNQVPAGTLTANVSTTTATTINVSATTVGVGSLLTIDTERLLVTGKSMLTTGLTLQANLSTADNDQVVQTTSGASFAVGETLLLDAERMLIQDIAGNNLTVKRAYDGSTLASHSGSTIFAPRTLTVERGAVGSTAATHTSTTAITSWLVPSGVQALATAEAINTLLQQEAGYTRTVGQGEAARNASAAGIADLRSQVYAKYGRKVRARTV